MKVIHRIPTTQYAYVEFEEEVDGPSEALTNHESYVKMYEDKVGLSTNEWAKIRNGFYATGQCDPEAIEQMNKAQRYVINQMKLAMRALDPQLADEVIN